MSMQAERGLALLRIISGLWFLKAALNHLTFETKPPWASEFWQQEMGRLMGLYGENHPFPWFKSFMEQYLVPNQATLAGVSSLVELVVAGSLCLGLLTPVGALAGLLYAGVFGLMKAHTGLGPQGLYLMLAGSMLVFALCRAGRHWGMDAGLARMWEDSPLW